MIDAYAARHPNRYRARCGPLGGTRVRARCSRRQELAEVTRSRSAAIVATDGERSLWWSYFSVAHSLEQQGNPPHRGGAELVISMKPKLSLAGDYWTERKTRGRLTTVGRSKHLYDDFQSALTGEYE